jgi:hypothetical protein
MDVEEYTVQGSISDRAQVLLMNGMSSVIRNQQ